MSGQLQHALDYLDDLPESLYVSVVTHHHGSLEQRCLGVLLWRTHLLQGCLPDIGLINWPGLPERQTLIKKLQSSSLVRHCVNNPATIDRLILDILEWLNDKQHDFETDENNETANADDNNVPDPDQKTVNNEADTEVTAEASQLADSTANANNNLALDDFSWQQQAQRLNELDDLMKDYAVMRKLGSDFSKGLLARTEWKDVLNIHKNIKHSQYLKNIISLIGRAHQVKAHSAGELDSRLKSQSNARKQKRLHFSHHAPMEASGITRSDDIGRMLPIELSALGHATLKRLWHVRRAERMLLSYQYDGVLSEHLPSFDHESLKAEKSGKQQLDVAGPMIIALDTSASMKGNPEIMGKAIVLEAMRVASRENRACLLLAFSGPGQIHEYELSSTEQGWHAMLDAISLSFHGGTDISTVIKHACNLIESKFWESADCMLVSDSRFQVRDELLDIVIANKADYGMRLHGINVSGWNSQAMEQLCQPVYRLSKSWI